ncbi:MAG: DUF4199 domain-containing protein [Nonlabens sp.]|uniref:DUF4199 domain-containing protein n=1 Tax=Nonlabens sp. TaxID=1888209 RepID=UPI003EF4E188
MSITRNTIKLSLAITAILIIYFTIIAIAGAADQIYLSFLNAPIMAIGLYLIIRNVYNEEQSQFNYMDGFTTGVASGFLISLLFTIFMAVYLLEINPDLVEKLGATIPIATGTGNFAILIFIFLSGLSTAVVSSLIIIPIFKRSWNTRQVRNEQKPLNQDI